MTPEEKDEIKEMLKEALNECHSDFYIEAEKHYLHHKQMDICHASKPEWEANHQFISDMRKNGNIVKKTSLSLMAAALVGWFLKVVFSGG